MEHETSKEIESLDCFKCLQGWPAWVGKEQREELVWAGAVCVFVVPLDLGIYLHMCVYGVPRVTCGLFVFCVYFLTCIYSFLNVFMDVGA